MRPSRPNCFLILVAAVAAGFAFHIGSLGFYNDDYPWLVAMSGTHSSAALMAASGNLFYFRPMDLIFYPSLFALFGANPLGYQLTFLLFDLAVAWSFFTFLFDEGVSVEHALLAALLATLHPSHDATHHWLAAATAPCALAITLQSLRLFRRWQKTGSCVSFTAGVASFSAATLLYEAAALLPLLLVVLAFDDARRSGISNRSALIRGLRSSTAPLSVLAALVFYQRGLVPRLLGAERHPMSFSVGHLFKVLQAGFECSGFNRLIDNVWRARIYSADHFHAVDWLFFTASATILIATVFWMRRDSESAPSRLLPHLAASFFLLGYAPYFFDAKYTPSIFDPTNRINMIGSLGGALALTWSVLRLQAARSQKARTAGSLLLASSLCGFLLADQVSDVQWSQAYALQNRVLSNLDPMIKAVPGPVDVLLYGVPDRIGSGSVFESIYDFDGALRLRHGRPELRGLVGSGRVRFDRGSAYYLSPEIRGLSYAHLYAYDDAADIFVRIDGPAAGNSFLAGSARP